MNRMLRTVSPRRILTRLAHRTSQGLGEPASAERPARPLMARAFSHPQGAGLLGPGTDSLLRAIFVDALLDDVEPTKVITTRHDVEHLFDGGFQQVLLERFGSVLHVRETLEDAIEDLEQQTSSGCSDEAVAGPSTLWLATPGADADVVHETLTSLGGMDIVALFKGIWPYGPTYVIDARGPRPLPSRINLLSTRQAISRLSTGH